MRRRWIALAIGLTVAAGILAWAELRVRGEELGSMQVCFDPPGMKYVLASDTETVGRGWQEGRAPTLRTEAKRIVCLGDSVTFGVSVGARETWCEDLRRALPRTEAFNFGMNGWDAEQVATLLETRIAAWHPDVVVWGTYVNDVFPTYLLYGQESGEPVFVGTDVPEQARILPEPVALFLVRRSALFRRLQGAAYARSEKAGGPGAARTGWYEAQVDRVAAWSRSTGIPVVYLAIGPHALANAATCPAQFPVPGLCEASERQYRSIVDALQVRLLPWVDGLAAFQASGQPHFHPPGRLDPDHPNAAGHAVLASAVLPMVRSALGLPEDAPTAGATEGTGVEGGTPTPSAGTPAASGALRPPADAQGAGAVDEPSAEPRRRRRPEGPRHRGGGRRGTRPDDAGG